MEKPVVIIPPVIRESVETPRLLRVAAYCRVSTDHDEQLGSLANQKEYYENYLSANPHYLNAGIFVDEGISGTTAFRRPGFSALINACDQGKVDLVITKSISRFARNTQDCLYYARKLKNMGIPIIFEKENINTCDSSGDLLFTILSCLAQEESRNISENTSWGIRSRFKQGLPHINANNLIGFSKNENGSLIICEKEAEIVHQIYRMFLSGYTPDEIARFLNQMQVKGVRGNVCWSGVTIKRILTNEKMKGDLLMQKTYTVDFLTKKYKPNTGHLPQYYIKGNHEAIVSPKLWEIAGLELARRNTFRQRHHLKSYVVHGKSCFVTRSFCARCGKPFLLNSKSEEEHRCHSDFDSYLPVLFFTLAVRHLSLAEYRSQLSETAVPEDVHSQYYRQRLLSALSEPIFPTALHQLARELLEEILVENPYQALVHFLGGAEIWIDLS